MPGEDRMDDYCDKQGSDGDSARGYWAGLMKDERRKEMDLINFVVWLTAGAVIGWFANRMVTTQHQRLAEKPKPSGDGSSE
jgi:hypothetical protein